MGTWFTATEAPPPSEGGEAFHPRVACSLSDPDILDADTAGFLPAPSHQCLTSNACPDVEAAASQKQQHVESRGGEGRPLAHHHLYENALNERAGHLAGQGEPEGTGPVSVGTIGKGSSINVG
jgi:hypothetical protein